MRLCIYVLSYQLYVLPYLLHLLLLVYPPFAYILYDECSEHVTGEYSSAKY